MTIQVLTEKQIPNRAIVNANNPWNALVRFVDDGEIAIDNNSVGSVQFLSHFRWRAGGPLSGLGSEEGRS